jgi:hypothetical protein
MQQGAEENIEIKEQEETEGWKRKLHSMYIRAY